MFVLVTVQGAPSSSGSGAGGTICVRGSITDSARKDLLRGFIRVRVLSGLVSIQNLPPPIPKQPGDVDTRPIGQDWCPERPRPVLEFDRSSDNRRRLAVAGRRRVGQWFGDVAVAERAMLRRWADPL